jgi:hypothetical protein
MTGRIISARLLAAALAALSLAAVDGCGPFWVNPYITVRESPLNWVHIHYYNMNRKPIRRVSVYINGMGHVELKKGTSDQISNDFAKKYKSEDWHDIKTQRVQIDPKHANDIFQNLVNYGILDREKTGKASKKETFDRFIAVKANFSSNTYSANENIFEVDPDLAEQLLDVVREFDNPTL